MPAAPKLLLLTHEFVPYPGGVGRYCFSVAAAAAALGYEVTVLAPEHSSSRGAGPEDPPGVRVVRFPGDVFDMRRLKELDRIVSPWLARDSWQIVHAADWPMVMSVGGLGVASGTQLLASFHGTDILLLRHSVRARLAGSSRRLRSFARYVFNSEFTARTFETAFPGLAGCDSVVAPLGVDDLWFEQPNAESRERFRRLIGYRPGDLLVLTVARLDDRKGHLQTIAAIGRLPAAARSTIVYVCVGLVAEQSLAKRILESARECGVRVCLTGALSVDLVRAAYSVADVFSLTAREMRRKVEGFGLVLLEAAAAGLPSVVTAVDAIPSVVLPGRTGWISAPQDLDEIAANIELALFTGARTLMQGSCVSHARQFSWRRCAQLTYGRTTRTPSASGPSNRAAA